jgi:ABC-type phosphate/phosphonate transport system ATPase subunit
LSTAHAENDRLARQFNSRSVLGDLSLQLQAYEYVAIVGQ